MTTLTNTITIQAPADQIWAILTNLAELEKYDPTVAKSTVTSAKPTGCGATRKVTMKDGTHWFNEQVTAFEPAIALTFELTSCNFPIKNLSHSYSFAAEEGQTTVTQIMRYTPRYGVAGKLMDAVVIRRRSDSGVKKFFDGLKARVEGT
jgi:ribosome-associated toxin RatA of RatAB toxin-antitoxin module